MVNHIVSSFIFIINLGIILDSVQYFHFYIIYQQPFQFINKNSIYNPFGNPW